eukprot:5410622-Amphidinium_carterae.2
MKTSAMTMELRDLSHRVLMQRVLLCLASSVRYLNLQRGQCEWHQRCPCDPRDPCAPFLRCLLHDQVADGATYPLYEDLTDLTRIGHPCALDFLLHIRADFFLQSEVLFTYLANTRVFDFGPIKKLGQRNWLHSQRITTLQILICAQ